MIEYITTEELLKKPKKISEVKLMSMWKNSHKQLSYFREVLFIAIEQQDPEVITLLNKCIDNEIKNADLLNEFMRQRRACRKSAV